MKGEGVFGVRLRAHSCRVRDCIFHTLDLILESQFGGTEPEEEVGFLVVDFLVDVCVFPIEGIDLVTQCPNLLALKVGGGER